MADICKDCTLSFKAIVKPADETFPALFPKWSGSATGTGETVDVTFATAGAQTVTATAGNAVPVPVGVVDNPVYAVTDTNVTADGTATPSRSFISPVDDGLWGRVVPEKVDFTITASHDMNNWYAILTGPIKGHYSIVTRLLPAYPALNYPSVKEAVAPNGNSNECNYLHQISDLSVPARDGYRDWFMQSAIKKHEEVHGAHFGPILKAIVPSFETKIEARTGMWKITIPNTGQTKAEAITGLKALNSYQMQSGSGVTSLWQTKTEEHVNTDHGTQAAPGPAITAELVETKILRDKIQTEAVAKNWNDNDCP